MIIKIKLFLLLSIYYISSSLAYLEYDSWLDVKLEHAIDPVYPNEFTFRGNVSIPSLVIGVANVQQQPLNLKQRQNLKKLAENNQFYRLKATVTYSDGNSDVFITSSKACALALAQLSDVLWIQSDIQGFVNAITQTVSGGDGDCKLNELTSEDLENFNTDVLIKHMEIAPYPDVTTYIQQIEREREARERGDVRDNRGFFAKYWMYIVPIALLVLLSGAANPDAGGSGGR